MRATLIQTIANFYDTALQSRYFFPRRSNCQRTRLDNVSARLLRTLIEGQTMSKERRIPARRSERRSGKTIGIDIVVIDRWHNTHIVRQERHPRRHRRSIPVNLREDVTRGTMVSRYILQRRHGRLGKRRGGLHHAKLSPFQLYCIDDISSNTMGR